MKVKFQFCQLAELEMINKDISLINKNYFDYCRV